jgi:hypothetical protein
MSMLMLYTCCLLVLCTAPLPLVVLGSVNHEPPKQQKHAVLHDPKTLSDGA